ncbi:MAG: hypothetical protein WCP06_04875 [Verrucomicrobiota bacterium]
MKIRILRAIAGLALIITITSCATVDVTKTAKGYFPPTNPNDVEILYTIPARRYKELGSVSTSGHDMHEEAKMHNAIRTKTAQMGATAVILQNQGIVPDGFGGGKRWATGVAVRYE